MADRRGTRCICIPVLCPVRCTETVYRVARRGIARGRTITISGTTVATEARRTEMANPEPSQNYYFFFFTTAASTKKRRFFVEKMTSLCFANAIQDDFGDRSGESRVPEIRRHPVDQEGTPRDVHTYTGRL